MKYLDIEAQIREDKGKNKVKKIRNAHYVPCVLYGGEETLLKIKESDAIRCYNVRHKNYFINLKFDSKEVKAFLKDIQLHPASNKILHLDFIELIKGKPIAIRIPVELKGTPIGVKKGGILEHFMLEIHIECLPDKIPENIEIDITNLEIGDAIHIKDLNLPVGVRSLDKEDQVIIMIGVPTGVEIEKEETAEESTEEGKTEEKKEE